MDALQGRTYIGGSLDIAGAAAIIDVGEVQLEDAVLELNFASGIAQPFGDGEEAGFEVGDDGFTGNAAPKFTFIKDGPAPADSYFKAKFNNAPAKFQAGLITASGLTSSADIATTTNLTVAGTGDVTGDFNVNTSKFQVSASSGNTTCAGTLTQAGAITVGGGYTGATGGGSTLSELGVAQFDTSIALKGSTAITAITENNSGSTVGSGDTAAIPTSATVYHHVTEAMKKVVSYVDNHNHFAHTSIAAPAQGNQVVTFSGVNAASQFSTAGTMDPSDYTVTINGLNIEPLAVNSIVDRTTEGLKYIDVTLVVSELDFHCDHGAGDEVCIHGPLDIV